MIYFLIVFFLFFSLFLSFSLSLSFFFFSLPLVRIVKMAIWINIQKKRKGGQLQSLDQHLLQLEVFYFILFYFILFWEKFSYLFLKLFFECLFFFFFFFFFLKKLFDY